MGSDRTRIAPGDRGEPVRDLKARLGALGYSLSSDESPYEFGPSTEAAIRAFQASRGLRVDGICGPQTWSALVESGFRLGDRLLYLRQPMLRGDDVAALQRALNALGFDAGREDGIFGPDTEAALREFQRNAGLTVDGICGPETVAALNRLGRERTGSVAAARERESLRRGRPLQTCRAFVLVEPGLEALGAVVRQALIGHGCGVLAEPAVDDESALAAVANASGADLVLLLRLGDEPGCGAAFYGSGTYHSERGLRLATCVLEELRPLLPAVRQPEPRAYAILRETRAPALVVEPAPAHDVDGVKSVVERAGEVGRAIVAGIRRAVEQPVES